MSAERRIALLGQLMERYNAQDVDGYAGFFAADGCEATYRGAVLRDGPDGIRNGYGKVFAEFPENRAEVVQMIPFAEQIVLQERVSRSPEAEPFDVLAIYSFDADDKISRVEFVR